MNDPSVRARYEIDEEVRVVEADSGAIVLHLRRGTYCRLNPLAMKIWRSIEQGLSVPDVLAQLENSFSNVGTERLSEDLSRFLAQLTKKGLVHAR
jgi:hypothetical protein